MLSRNKLLLILALSLALNIPFVTMWATSSLRGPAVPPWKPTGERPGFPPGAGLQDDGSPSDRSWDRLPGGRDVGATGPGQAGPGKHGPGNQDPGGPFAPDRGAMGGLGGAPQNFMRRIGVTDEQWTKMEPRQKAFHESLHADRDVAERLHRELIALIGAPQADPEAIRSKQRELVEAYGKQQAKMVDNLLADRADLTADQFARLIQMLGQRGPANMGGGPKRFAPRRPEWDDWDAPPGVDNRPPEVERPPLGGPPPGGQSPALNPRE